MEHSNQIAKSNLSIPQPSSYHIPVLLHETIDALQIDDLMARVEVRKPSGWDDSDSNSNTNSDSDSNEDGAEKKSRKKGRSS
mgnify:CR=1 FL=1